MLVAIFPCTNMWLYAFVTTLVSVVTAQYGDPCLEENHKNLSNIYRSTGFESRPPYIPICDDTLETDWYRMDSDAGNQMPEHCVDRLRCGTIAPIWMNGKHPSVSDNEVLRYACVSLRTPQDNNCCAETFQIGVKNCFDQFYVYLLVPTSSCSMAYCAGDGTICPVGRWSRNHNLQPGCVELPSVSFSRPIVSDKKFHFNCEITFNENEPDLAFEVVWLFDGAEDPNLNVTRVYQPNKTATLEGWLLKGRLNRNIGCKVRLFYIQNTDVYSPWTESNTYWAGIKVEPRIIKVMMDEMGTYTVSITSTIPILCNHNLSNCMLRFMLAINASYDVIKVTNNCAYTLDGTNWNDESKQVSINISLVTSREQREVNEDAQLTFQRLPTTLTGGPYQEIFQELLLNSVQLQVQYVEAKLCTLLTDPHITGIEGNRFNLYTVGEYTAFQSSKLNFEVQIQTWKCNRDRASCICSVAVRERNDLIRIVACHSNYYNYQTNSASPEVQVIRKRNATIVQQSPNGATAVVYLPSGAEISATAYSGMNGYMDITVSIPPVFKNNGRGLCGTFDNIKTNEYTRRDGTVDAACNDCTPTVFTESWKVPSSESLFSNQSIHFNLLLNDDYEPKFCTCNQFGNESRIECPLRSSATILPCPSCKDVGGVCTKAPVLCPGDGRPGRAVLYADADEPNPPYDPNLFSDFQPAIGVWPTRSNITELMAEQKCRESLQQSQIWTSCAHQVDDIENKIYQCKEDVKLGDNYETLESMIDSFTLSCQVEMTKDPNNYVTTEDGQSMVKSEISNDICSIVCQRHGYCEKGVCICDEGFSGSNCQLLKNQPPVLRNIRGLNICDINERPCRKVFIDASDIEMTDTMACKISDVLRNGSIANTSLQVAEFITIQKLACSLPDAQVKSDRSVKKFMITATIDGVLYSNALNMTVFDSTCQNCTDKGCTKLPGTCLIKDLCYQDGDINPDDNTQICNVTSQEFQWSLVPTLPSEFPVIVAVNLLSSGDGLTCSVITTEIMPGARYRVSWFVDNQPISIELRMSTETLTAFYPISDLPASGNVTCKIRSYYSDVNILSPYVISNTINLTAIRASG